MLIRTTIDLLKINLVANINY